MGTGASTSGGRVGGLLGSSSEYVTRRTEAGGEKEKEKPKLKFKPNFPVRKRFVKEEEER